MSIKFHKAFLVIGIAATLAAAAFWPAFRAADDMEVDFLDVGQGDGILIKTPYGQNILIDGGPDGAVIKRLSEELPWWDKRIDLMVLTHPHGDHLVGLIDVMKRYEVKKILYTGAIHTSSDYFAWLNAVKTKKIPLVVVARPLTIRLGQESELNIIYPRRSLAGKTINNLNNSSIVVKLRYGATEFLFTGDIESEAEEELVGFVAAGRTSRPTANLRADVLKVAHHGSGDSSGWKFLKRVMPKIAVIQVGADNEFGHPDRRVVKRLERINARVLRTDLDGTVKLTSDGKAVTVSPSPSSAQSMKSSP